MDKSKQNKLKPLQAIKIALWSIKQLYGVDKLYTTVVFGSRIYRYLNDIISNIVFAKLVDSIIKFASTQDSSEVNLIFSIAIIFFSLSKINNYINGYVQNLIRNKSRFLFSKKFYNKLEELGVQSIEDSEVSDKIYRANDELYQLHSFALDIMDLIGQYIGGISYIAAVATFLPIAIPIILITSIPKFVVEQYYLKKDWDLYYNNTELFRIKEFSLDVLRNKSRLAEIYLSNATSYFDKKYLDFANWRIDQIKKLYQKWYAGSYLSEVLADIPFYIFVFVLIQNVAKNLISIGDFTFQYRSVSALSNYLSNSFFQTNYMIQRVTRIKEIYDLFTLEPLYLDGNKEIKKYKNPPVIELKNLNFAYKGSNKNVLKDINLTINPGEKVAIVGKNGSGKTTLVKLLSRIYPVKEGSILIDNKNLNDIKSSSWFKNLGVLFQEFNKYEYFTVKENIEVGDIEKSHKEKDILQAIESADATEFVNSYESKLDQILSEDIKGGIRPSGGQWQKLALARFFYRDASVIIFDEPTAAIDAEAEFKIFNNIFEFFKKKTVILISHRFSTVRNADKIIVLDNGEVKEVGNHKELMAKDGIYAKFFKLQAKGYQ